MKIGLTLGGLVLGGSAVLLGQWLSQPVATAVPGDDGSGGTAGGSPDVIVGAIPDVSKWGTANGITSFSFGSTSCNIGDQQLLWQQNTNQHPVIPQNAYRLKDGRFQQIGMSFVKHGFCALQQNLCGPCQPAGGGCPPVLGIGCSDPYSSGLNGSQSTLGPRWQVNASTGVFPYPFQNPPQGSTPTALWKRVQLKNDDINPALNSGALYFAEAQYIHPQDAAGGNAFNNASYRRFTTSGSGTNFTVSLTGPTFQQQPAIFAWKNNDSNVTLVNVDIENDGRFWIGYRVFDNGDGTWRYEFAVQNLNSDRSAGSLSLPIPDGVTVSNIGFSAPAYHSGEPFSNTPWSSTFENGVLTWATQPHAENANASALRWSTLYNFWFTADTPPAFANGTLGLFKPGAAPNPSFAALLPSVPAIPCVGDFSGDDKVDATDLGFLLGSWGSPNGDLDGDGDTNSADLAILLGAWGSCP